MKIKIISMTSILGPLITITAMEQKDINLEGMLLEPAMLKFQAAWKVAQSGRALTSTEAPEEILELIKKIRNALSCGDCTFAQRQLFINLLNNPDFDVRKLANLVHAYLPKKPLNEVDKQKLLNNMLTEHLVREHDPSLLWGPSRTGLNISMIKLLIDAGVDVNAPIQVLRYGEEIPLSFAASFGNKKIVKMLIKGGADIDSKNEALRGTSDIDVAKLLLKSGADVNSIAKNGQNALINAAHGWKYSKESDRVAMAKFLLDSGADFDAKDNFGQTALKLAKKYRHKELAKLLIDAGAKE